MFSSRGDHLYLPIISPPTWRSEEAAFLLWDARDTHEGLVGVAKGAENWLIIPV